MSVLTIVAIKHTDRVNTENMLTLWNVLGTKAKLGRTALPLFTFFILKYIVWRQVDTFITHLKGCPCSCCNEYKITKKN